MMDNPIILTFKGKERAANQDVTVYGRGDNGNEFLMIADGATNAKDSGEYVARFCTQLYKQWLEMKSPAEESKIQALIKDIHRQLQRDFICSKGSFLLLIIESRRQHCFYLGDCRLGMVEGNSINWKTYPHTLASRSIEHHEEKQCMDPTSHILFKMLKSARFSKPTYKILHLDLNKPVILATDGFWRLNSLLLPHPLTEQTMRDHMQYMEFFDDSTILIRMC